MQKNEPDQSVCNLKYLSDMMGGKNTLINGIIDSFLIQMPEELQSISDAIKKSDFPAIKGFAHTMKSSVSIMGISVLAPILQEMENLGAAASDIEKIKLLEQKLNLICKQAAEEIERQKHNYV